VRLLNFSHAAIARHAETYLKFFAPLARNSINALSFTTQNKSLYHNSHIICLKIIAKIKLITIYLIVNTLILFIK